MNLRLFSLISLSLLSSSAFADATYSSMVACAKGLYFRPFQNNPATSNTSRLIQLQNGDLAFATQRRMNTEGFQGAINGIYVLNENPAFFAMPTVELREPRNRNDTLEASKARFGDGMFKYSYFPVTLNEPGAPGKPPRTIAAMNIELGSFQDSTPANLATLPADYFTVYDFTGAKREAPPVAATRFEVDGNSMLATRESRRLSGMSELRTQMGSALLHMVTKRPGDNDSPLGYNIRAGRSLMDEEKKKQLRAYKATLEKCTDVPDTFWAPEYPTVNRDLRLALTQINGILNSSQQQGGGRRSGSAGSAKP